MMNPYDRRRRAAQPQHVPIELARKLKAERDRLAEMLERARRDHDRISAELEAERVERDALESRLEQAESRIEQLRDERARRDSETSERGSATESAEPEAARQAKEPVRPESASSEAAEDAVTRLSKRVADLTNDLERVQRRTRTTVDEARRDERVRILSGLGEVLDSVERALEFGADGPWAEGLRAIRDQIFAFMRAEGATITGKVGERMDPRLHEAIAVVEDDQSEAGEIVAIDRHGIELEDGTVARTAQVHVAA